MTRAEVRAQAKAKPARAVFVDGSGHRVRAVRALALTGVAVVCAYVGLVIASLFGVPSIVSPVLPPAQAEKAAVGEPAHHAATRTPTPSSTPEATRGATPSTPAAPVPSTAVAAYPSQAPAATPVPTPVATPTPTPTASAHGKSSTAPGKADPPTHPAKP
jgi:hypothetical protein